MKHGKKLSYVGRAQGLGVEAPRIKIQNCYVDVEYSTNKVAWSIYNCYLYDFCFLVYMKVDSNDR